VSYPTSGSEGAQKSLVFKDDFEDGRLMTDSGFSIWDPSHLSFGPVVVCGYAVGKVRGDATAGMSPAY
jgi:hypothetical protein